MWDVVIVGGGPSGCRVATEISKRGYEVCVVEEHPKIGIPTQCAGLVSWRIGKLPSKLILNKIKVAKFCCRGASFEVKSKRPMYVIDRKSYDELLAKEAKKAGVKFKLDTRFLNFGNGKVFTTAGNYPTKLLVGADGPNSTVARVAGIKLPQTLLRAVQSKVKSNFDAGLVELWFGSDIAPGNFAWIVPESEEIARVGLMVKSNPNPYFERFLRKRFRESKVSERIGDITRYGLIESSVADNVLLVGDAACQVKPFSLGGLIYGKLGARLAASACIQALERNDFSESFLLRSYDAAWKRKLRLPIMKGLALKSLFSALQDSPAFFRVADSCLSRLALLLDVDFY